jgi:malate dehydrogenase (oxaloacetate-decarboxylating)(NADP+)
VPNVLSDTAINIDPSADDLKNCIMTAKTARMFGVDPVIAMVSFSNFGSSTDQKRLKLERQWRICMSTTPILVIDGEVQADFAESRNA